VVKLTVSVVAGGSPFVTEVLLGFEELFSSLKSLVISKTKFI
jgi:hypothetical protein